MPAATIYEQLARLCGKVLQGLCELHLPSLLHTGHLSSNPDLHLYNRYFAIGISVCHLSMETRSLSITLAVLEHRHPHASASQSTGMLKLQVYTTMLTIYTTIILQFFPSFETKSCYCSQACLALTEPPISDVHFKTSLPLFLCKRPNRSHNFHATIKAFLTKYNKGLGI